MAMTTRTFIALELDAAQQHFLDTIIRQGRHLLPDLRWVDSAGIHLTLAFLGELDDTQLAQVREAAEYAAGISQPFTYRLSGLGTFGSPRQPRVLWMGVSEPSGALHVVHQALTLALEQRDFATEKRPFSPHLTLARIKAPLTPEQVQILQQLLSRYQFESPAYRVAHLYVMTTVPQLQEDGNKIRNVYRCLTSIPLR